MPEHNPKLHVGTAHWCGKHLGTMRSGCMECSVVDLEAKLAATEKDRDIYLKRSEEQRTLKFRLTTMETDRDAWRSWGRGRGPDPAILRAEKAEAEVERLEKETVPRQQIVDWAVGRWFEEVSRRPEENIHDRTLNNGWRQVIRRWGGEEALAALKEPQP